MGTVKNPAYQAALRNAVISQCLEKNIDPGSLHKVPEDVLFDAWRKALKKLMASNEYESFLLLSPEGQREYFSESSFFRFSHFLSEFIAQARRNGFATIQ